MSVPRRLLPLKLQRSSLLLRMLPLLTSQRSHLLRALPRRDKLAVAAQAPPVATAEKPPAADTAEKPPAAVVAAAPPAVEPAKTPAGASVETDENIKAHASVVAAAKEAPIEAKAVVVEPHDVNENASQRPAEPVKADARAEATKPANTQVEQVVAQAPSQVSQPADAPKPSEPTVPELSDFNEAGYQAVAASKSNGKMGQFVRLLLKSQGRMVSDMDAFRAFLPQFSGARGKKSFQALLEELSQAPFVTKRGLEFSEDGYQAVAALKDNGKMGEYVRAYLSSQHKTVVDFDAFRAFLPEYSGMRGTKNFQALARALNSAPFTQAVN
eukprot:TRINITY_DN696_c0_g1_i4.p1 TRINITY_DN696_c0_g1~~TRINITY_DN696_c0_g1_i4.p1  ORF type:complete len:327 (-),score=85.67 TRINITY_DN696_c0_g1_i4:157-1137(-)